MVVSHGRGVMELAWNWHGDWHEAALRLAWDRHEHAMRLRGDWQSHNHGLPLWDSTAL